MKVHQLVYTKVPKEDSPWGKRDFHTVFYPIKLLTKRDVFEIEKRIHFPSYKGFNKKEVVFYHNIQGKDYLIILYIQNLPEARDTFGRGGIFICHGFIFPPELWKLSTMHSALFELVRDSLFANREEVLSSPLVNKKTGDIQPIDIPEERLNNLPQDLPKLKSEFEWKIAILFNRIAAIENSPSVVLKGTPEEISRFVDRLFAYITCDLKPNLAYDTAFDGGNLTYFPIKIVGFKDNPPTGGNPIKIDLHTQSVEEQTEFLEFFQPQTPYQRWMYHCHSKIQSKDEIDKAYRLSLFLEGKALSPTKEELLPQWRDFVYVNKELIEEYFIKKCQRYMGEKVAKSVAEMLDLEAMLDFLIDSFPSERLAGYVEEVIIRERLIPETQEMSLSESLIKAGSNQLRLIGRLWKRDVIKFDDMISLDAEKRYEFVKYLLLTKYRDKNWFLDILKRDRDMFNQFLSSFDTKQSVINLLMKDLQKERDIAKITDLVLKYAIELGKTFDLLKREVNPKEIIEEYIKRKLVGEKEAKRLISWAKKARASDSKFPYIKAFLCPKEGISDELLQDVNLRKRLIKWLVHYHGYGIKKLKKLGFREDELVEIDGQIKKKNWLKRAFKFFKF